MEICIMILVIFVIGEGYCIKECGQNKEKDEYCNYGCKDEGSFNVTCPWYNSVIKLHSGSYGYWDCDENDDCCTLPDPDDPDDPDVLCMAMNEDEYEDALDNCNGTQYCNVKVKRQEVKHTDCCPKNEDWCKKDKTHVTALMWSCIPVDNDLHTATGCYASVETLELECFLDLVINITSNEFGLSECPGNNSCCPAPDDCIIPGSQYPERLEEIKLECQGRMSCRMFIHHVGHVCRPSSATDYENIHYSCVEASTTLQTSFEQDVTSDDATTVKPSTLSPEPTTEEQDQGPPALLMAAAGAAAVGLIGIVAAIITCAVCWRRKKPNGSAEAKNHGPARQPSVLNAASVTTEDDPAKYYGLGDLKPRKDQGEHDYDYPDLVKPSVKPKPHTALTNGMNQRSKREIEDIDNVNLPDNSTMVQMAERFDPSKNNPAYIPDPVDSRVYSLQQDVPGNEYSYTYGHWGTEPGLSLPESDTNVASESHTSDTNAASARPTSDTNVEFHDNEVYENGLRNEDDEVIVADNEAYGNFGRPDNDEEIIMEDNDAYSET